MRLVRLPTVLVSVVQDGKEKNARKESATTATGDRIVPRYASATKTTQIPVIPGPVSASAKPAGTAKLVPERVLCTLTAKVARNVAIARTMLSVLP